MEIKAIVISLVTFFVILLVLYRVFEDEIFAQHMDRCEEDEVCVRFCCVNVTTCENETHFDVSEWEHATDLKRDFKVLKGVPCKDGYLGEAPWSFLEV